MINSDADKTQILSSLASLLKKLKRIRMVFIHYNGHGTVTPRVPDKSGRWKCANKEVLLIEEILAVVSENTPSV